MYKIIGADGKEYGPVSAEQLRQWISERRANATTQVFQEGWTEWKTLGSLPEFSFLLTAAGQPAAAVPPSTYPMTPGVYPMVPFQRTHGMAVTGMIMGILSLVFCCCRGIPFNILGIIFSSIALVQINKNPQLYTGKGMAISGLVMSIVSLVIYAILFLLQVAVFSLADVAQRFENL